VRHLPPGWRCRNRRRAGPYETCRRSWGSWNHLDDSDVDDAYVQEYKTKEGDFVGIPKEGTSNSQIWDLTDNKPALKEMKPGDITSQKQNEKWKHPPATATYTPQELADLIAWLKYASTGKNVEIKLSDVQ